MNNLNSKKVSIVTVTLECKGGKAPEKSYRDDILTKVVQTFGKEDIILFPAGFYRFPVLDPATENRIVDDIRKLLSNTESNATVCLGIDADDNGKGKNEQFAIAINKCIVAKGRKFYPAKRVKEDGKGKEKENVQIAESFNSKEAGYERVFECKGKRFYLAVCYDVYGIRHRKIANPGVDAVLNPVHFFTLEKEGSGFSYCVRYGFGGASLHWGCPVFGAAVFFEREVPEKWQSGFLCRNKIENLQSIKYSDNGLKPDKQDCYISTACEKAVCRLYSI
jgi:hypothetical protein